MPAGAVRSWVLLRLLLLSMALLGLTGSAAAAATSASVTSTSIGTFAPTFVGPAATGCAAGCQLLTGPFPTPSTSSQTTSASPTSTRPLPDHARALPSPRGPAVRRSRAAATAASAIPNVICQPLSAGCDMISTKAGGAVGVKGINAVDSARSTTNIFKDVEPPDQGLCAGNGFVVEDNNIGEMRIFNTSLKSVSPVISLDTVMGLTQRGWSSGGDTSCDYDPSNGGHWFFTEFASASPEATGGPFAGCFAGVASTCYEAIAVTRGSSPFGPYNVYFLNANYNPSEPGYPFELNDFTKIGVTRDAFLLFYDEFPLNGNGIGGGFFNGAQEFAFNKTALEKGEPVLRAGGSANPAFNVALENMGRLATPDGTCANDGTFHQGGVSCWFSVIPANPPDAADWDNSNGGSGFMLDTIDYYGTGGNRLAVWDWTGLSRLTSANCSTCSGIRFGGQLFSGVNRYYDSQSTFTGYVAAQKAGPIPLGDECAKAGLSSDTTCPENGIATDSDQVTQVSQAQGHLWAGVNTEINQQFASQPANPETHAGTAYWVVSTRSFDQSRQFTLTSQGYAAAAHEDLEYPAMAGEGAASAGGNGKAIVSFTLSGNGGLPGADNGGFYPSSAYGRLNSNSGGLLGSMVNVADLGRSPEDGFSEYQGYPDPAALQPRWGDYGNAIFLPNSGGRIYFASEYIQSPNCLPPQFTLTIGTCGGTRDGMANWGTSVNYVIP
jgi:hypothetical protein